MPAELGRRIHLFQANGRIHREHDELFAEVAWLQVMIGQNIIPRSYHPLADRLNTDQLNRYLGNIRRIVGGIAGKLPPHGDFIARNCAWEKQE